MRNRKKIITFIIFASLLRFLIAGSLELGNDEAYYQLYARYLQWSYFDHPPMVAWLIRLSTVNLYFDQEIFIRAGAVICAAIGTWLAYLIGSHIRNENTGWFFALLYSTSFYSSIIAGVFILPDSPLVVFWLASIYCMLQILKLKEPGSLQGRYFIFLGITVGLCIMSKLHGIFLWFGFGAYILFHRRHVLKNPFLWLSVLITVAIISPIYFWNVSNRLITYNYHQERLNFFGRSPDPSHLFQQVFGSVFYSNPINFMLFIGTAIALTGKGKQSFPVVFPLFLWLSLPLIGILFWTSLFNETLPHWSGPAWLSWMILTACWLDGMKREKTIRWIRASGGVMILVIVISVMSIRYLPVYVGSNQPGHAGKGDIMLDLSGWKKFAYEFDSLYRSDLQYGRMKKNPLIISDYWFPAGHLDHYYAIPFHRNLMVFGPLNNIHHFAWVNAKRPKPVKGQDAYFIYLSNYYGPPADILKKKFVLVEDSVLIPQYRSGIMVREFVVYRMHGFQGDSLDFLIPGIK